MTNIADKSTLFSFLNDPTSTVGILVSDINISGNTVLTSVNKKTLISQDKHSIYTEPTTITNTSGIQSKNITTDDGYTIGEFIDKDMYIDVYDYEMTPIDYPDLFPDTAEFSEGNIVAGDKSEGDRLNASYWDDWGNDVFDNWGFFYLYDVNSGKYYFPLINPMNDDDGIITTQTFNAFGRTFTMQQGYPVEGIFKFEITVDDDLPFRFGAYGNMGSDGYEVVDFLTSPYSIGITDLTLYYNKHAQRNRPIETLYTYVIPRNVSENNSQTYNMYDQETYMSVVSKEVTNGILVYFSKTNDVKDWIIHDLEIIP